MTSIETHAAQSDELVSPRAESVQGFKVSILMKNGRSQVAAIQEVVDSPVSSAHGGRGIGWVLQEN